MKLTPIDIRHKEFRRAMRGYSEEEVDIFLDEVADEFERLFQGNIELQDRIARLDDQVAQFDNLKETLQKTLVSAQQQADEMRANARKEAELTLRDAELKARDIIADSYAEKQKVQQSLLQLRQVEEDFRFKFQSLLQAHLNLLKEDEESEDRSGFGQIVSGVERELTEGIPEPGKVGAGGAAGSSSVRTPPSGGSEATDDRARGAFAAEQADAAAQSAAQRPAAQAPVFARDSVDAAAGEEVTAETYPVEDDAMEREFLGQREAVSDETARSLPPSGHPQGDLAAAPPGDDDFLVEWDERDGRSKSGAVDEEAFPAGEEQRAASDAGMEPEAPGYESKARESSVRRFLFGAKGEEKKERPGEEDDRDFQW